MSIADASKGLAGFILGNFRQAAGDTPVGERVQHIIDSNPDIVAVRVAQQAGAIPMKVAPMQVTAPVRGIIDSGMSGGGGAGSSWGGPFGLPMPIVLGAVAVALFLVLKD